MILEFFLTKLCDWVLVRKCSGIEATYKRFYAVSVFLSKVNVKLIAARKLNKSIGNKLNSNSKIKITENCYNVFFFDLLRYVEQIILYLGRLTKVID